MRISRSIGFLVTGALAGCVYVNADAPPGAVGYRFSPASMGMGPVDFYQTVLVIAPERGSGCTSRTSGVVGVESQTKSNDQRESFLRINLTSKDPTIRCWKDGKIVKRTLPRLTFPNVQMDPLYLNRGSSDRDFKRTAYVFPPVFHVPGPDARADERWDTWVADNCDSPDNDQIVLLCTRGLAEARAADLGSQ